LISADWGVFAVVLDSLAAAVEAPLLLGGAWLAPARFSTERMADLIVVLDGARVAGVGTHEELMARGSYAELYGIQAPAYR
jgi:hypothetical protein